MKIPKSVKVGPYVYAVKRVRDLRSIHDASQTLQGQCHFGPTLIEIREDMVPDRQGETLLHEAVHAIDEYMHIGLSEKQVARLSTGLMAFLRDNNLLRTV